jgi:hypothetical protein
MQERKLGESKVSIRLLAMLRNTLQSYPRARLMTRRGVCGVFMADGGYLYVSYSGSLTVKERRDLLALFVTWWQADPNGLEKAPTPLTGVSVREIGVSALSRGRRD